MTEDDIPFDLPVRGAQEPRVMSTVAWIIIYSTAAICAGIGAYFIFEGM